MLLLLLPLLNSSSMRNLLRPFSKDKSSSSAEDDTLCPICRSTPTIPFVALPCQHRCISRHFFTYLHKVNNSSILICSSHTFWIIKCMEICTFCHVCFYWKEKENLSNVLYIFSIRFSNHKLYLYSFSSIIGHAKPSLLYSGLSWLVAQKVCHVSYCCQWIL